MSLVARILNKPCPIVIAQYERDDFTVGDEEKLHWAIIVLTKPDALEGHVFQAIDRIYSDERGEQWSRHYQANGSVLKAPKCVGLAQIGAVKAREVQSLLDLVGTSDNSKGYPALKRFEGWRCKDWVLEVVDLLRERNPGWIATAVVPDGEKATRDMFFPALRRAGKSTVEARKKNPLAAPSVEWLGGSR
ncbi:hypothetical protein C8R46DRAFT_884416 [Mycena filopes]|nr:hypothetical protein C8R46DRAFT_884416 [Mycena filopes]